MRCAQVRRGFSEQRDGVSGAPGEMAAHLASCPPCAAAWRAFNAPLDLLAAEPRVDATGEIAARVFDRLDMERRQPGLSMLFRPFGAARPLILPSLVPAVAVLVVVLSGALALDRGPATGAAAHAPASGPGWGPALPASGTESNPLFETSEVSSPRVRSGQAVPQYLLDHPGPGTLFLETVVARDGSVSAVNVIGGDSEAARPVVDALRRERYEPGRFRGRVVAVSIYRLISRMEVWGS
ncbi:MAG TPA: hypothetical protein VMR21_04405 [Vicinamibacteria bacterium]|nr:hypothetical protein [Vicinamibacteria bacterium]